MQEFTVGVYKLNISDYCMQFSWAANVNVKHQANEMYTYISVLSYIN